MEKVENNLKTIFEYKPFLEETEAGVFEEVWTTKDGVKIPFSEVTQQHWSNIYWYHRYMFEISEDRNPPFLGLDEECNPVFDIKHRERYSKLMDVALTQLKLLFEGELLDWVPVYENEKSWYKKQSTRNVLIEKFKEKIKL